MSESVFGVLGLFPSADALLEAIPKVRKEGFARLEAFTPYPVHGLDEALGLPKSRLGVLVFIIAAIGAIAAFAFEWWTSAVSYPLLTAGKAMNGWQAWVPVMLEGTILFGTFTAGLAMLFVFNKLPFFGNPVLHSKAIDEITRDRFALMVAPDHGRLDTDAASAALRAAGGEAIEVLPVPHYAKVGFGWWARTAAAIAAACVVAGLGTAWAIRTFPTTRPMVEMESQARLDAQAADSFFPNGRGMQRPPPGTVPRGYMPILATSSEQAGRVLMDPLPVTARVLERGRRMFDIHCAVCHDRLGTGKAWLDSTYQAQPADLQSATVREAPDGTLYQIMSEGYGTMPAYAADISQSDRWAIVRYIRALQRSQDAPARDLTAAGPTSPTADSAEAQR
jgi:mono/diheme cytochrome c family protein